MNTRDSHQRPDRALWRHAAPATSADPRDCPSPAMLAAWIDGRLLEHERPEIEAHLARCSGCLRAAREVHRLQEAERAAPTPVPPEMLARARAARPARAAADSRPRRLRPAWRGVPWAAAAAAMVAAGAIGYLGYEAGDRAFARPAAARGDLGAAMSFGTLDASDDDAVEVALLLPLVEEASP